MKKINCILVGLGNIGINYDINKCEGFPRDYEMQHQSDITRGFGFDTGYEFRSQNCKNTRNSNYNLKINSRLFFKRFV